jgi:phosphoglycolate phosphatase
MSPIPFLRRKPKEGLAPVIMFDFDGVIADSFEVFYAEFGAAVRALGFERLSTRESLLQLFEGNMFRSLVKMGFPMRKLRNLGKEFQPRIAAANETVEPFAGMPELLAELAAAHPTYIITSNQTAAIERFLERFQVEGVRDVLGADKEPSKVKKIRRVSRNYRGHTPWYIGDTKGDMLEGNEAGAITVGAAWGWHGEAKLLEGAARHIVHSPADLRKLFLS